MKGLLLKDLCVLKGFCRQYGISFLLMIIWAVFMKNASFLVIYAMIIGGMQVMSSLSMDEAVHFNRWALTTSVGAKGLILEKYILLLLTMGIGTAAGALLNLILKILFDGAGALEWEGLIGSVAIFIIAYAITLPFSFKWGPEKTKYVYIGATFGATAIFVGWVNMFDWLGIPVEEFMENAPIACVSFVIGICAAMLIISYQMSLKVVKNKEW